VRNINFKILGEVVIGWISTPLFSGILAFFSLFFVKNIFNIDVGRKFEAIVDKSGGKEAANIVDPGISGILQYTILGLMAIGSVGILMYYFLERKKKLELRRSEDKFWKNIK
jgi:phosphate/sulfate permease